MPEEVPGLNRYSWESGLSERRRIVRDDEFPGYRTSTPISFKLIMFVDELYVKTTEQRRGGGDMVLYGYEVYIEFIYEFIFHIFHTIFVKIKLQICFVIYSSRYKMV